MSHHCLPALRVAAHWLIDEPTPQRGLCNGPRQPPSEKPVMETDSGGSGGKGKLSGFTEAKGGKDVHKEGRETEGCLR